MIVNLYRFEHTGYGHRGSHGFGHAALVEYHFFARADVSSHTVERNLERCKVLTTFCAGHRVEHVFDTAAFHHSQSYCLAVDDGETEDVGDAVNHFIRFVGEGTAAVGEQREPLLGLEHRLELSGRVSCGVEASYNGTYRCADDVVGFDAVLFEYLQHADFCCAFGTSASKHQSDLRAFGQCRCQHQGQACGNNEYSLQLRVVCGYSSFVASVLFDSVGSWFTSSLSSPSDGLWMG